MSSKIGADKPKVNTTKGVDAAKCLFWAYYFVVVF